MKKFNKISIFLLLLLGFAINSCDDVLNLDLLDDPNDITLDKANLDRFLNTIQIDFVEFTHYMGQNGSELTRLENMFGRQYINNYASVYTSNEWNIAYQRMFSDIKAAEELAVNLESNKHIGIMKVMKAYTLLTLVDFFGDIPLSEATQPEEFPFPHADDDAAVYQTALGMLDSAVGYLQADGPDLQNDFFYGNDFSKWEKLANTLKMRAYVNTRLVDSDAINKFNAIVNSGNYISNTSNDFQFRYGTSIASPNTRHNAYDTDYTATGAGSYRSNWLMDEMLFDEDPRIRYYFYRQVDCTPGNGCAPNQAQLPCSVQGRPAHYPADMIFCSVAEGYWGRDHGNAEGIPPDSFRRTASGVYPAGGKFDDNDFVSITLGDGGQGAGITPLMLASWVDLMKAEMAMVNNPANGWNHLQASLIKSIDKVMTFRTLDPDSDASFAPSASEVSGYIANVGGDFNSASTEDKWELLAVQYFVAHYGNGHDAYNFYRRTGYPTSLQYNVEPNGGNFVRSFLYPSSEADVNNNIVQKPNVDIQVFWDNNPPSPGFPAAN